MHMYYWFGTNLGDFLFNGFTITTTAGLVSICLGMMSLAILFEGIKVELMSTRQKYAEKGFNIQSRDVPSEASSLLNNHNNFNCAYTSFMWIHQLALFLSRDILSYTLMLAVMTYNGYFTISISIGAGIGFFLFSPILMEIGSRNVGLYGHQLACPECIAKLKRMEESEDCDSSTRVLEVAEGVYAAALDAPNSSTFNTEHTTAVVQIHSTNEGHDLFM